MRAPSPANKKTMDGYLGGGIGVCFVQPFGETLWSRRACTRPDSGSRKAVNGGVDNGLFVRARRAFRWWRFENDN
ncbi:protein of unknown function [Pararobbsia alpina]